MLRIALLVFMLTLTMPVSAAAIRVGGECTLADAIVAANTDAAFSGCTAGSGADVIHIWDDRTDDNITYATITTDITIAGHGFRITSTRTNHGFTVDGGSLTLRNIIMQDYHATTTARATGGAVSVNNGTLTLDRVTMEYNVANDSGGAIYAINSDVSISQSTIQDSQALDSHGGAIYFSGSSNTLVIDDSTFRENEADEDGGAIKIAAGDVDITKSSFIENEADEGGAIEVSGAELYIANSTFSGNEAREGGAISSFNSTTELIHVTFAGNLAAEQGDGLAVIGFTGDVKIKNTIVDECEQAEGATVVTLFEGNLGTCAEAEAQSATGPTGLMDLEGDPPYHPLTDDSPAKDAADSDHCLDDDQPETDRPQGDNCDVGAYEIPADRPPSPTPSNTPVPTDTPEPTNTPEPRDPEEDEPEVPPDDTPAPPQNTAAPTLTPTVGPTATVPPYCIRIVQPGENLFRIATSYGMTVRELSSFNNLFRDDQLEVGQELWIPHEGCPDPADRKG